MFLTPGLVWKCMRFVHPIARFCHLRAFFRIVTPDPDKVWQNVKPALDPNYLKLHGGIHESLNLKVDFKKWAGNKKETQITKHAKMNK